MVSNGGFTEEQLAGTSYNAFRHAMDGKGPPSATHPGGQELPSWQDLPEEAQAAWVDAAGFACELLYAHEGRSLAWEDGARQLYERYARTLGIGATGIAWGTLAVGQRWSWQAALRHLVNVLMLAEDEAVEHLDQHESRWRQWAASKRASPESE